MKELLEIQQSLKVPKGQYNSYGKYKYRSCEDILEALKPIYTALGCTLTLTDEIVCLPCDLSTHKSFPVFVEEKEFNGENKLIAIHQLAKMQEEDYHCTMRVYVKATVTLTNVAGESVSAVAYAREEDVKKGMDGSQVTGAASSYARKYALNGLFAIDDTKDADVTNTHIKGVEDIIKECKTMKALEALWKDNLPAWKDDAAIRMLVDERIKELNGKEK